MSRLGAPRSGLLGARPVVVPPIVLVVGLAGRVQGRAELVLQRDRTASLVGAYVILAFPYMFFSIDAGLRAIDLHTLTEASQSLGASWVTTMTRVILPNIRVAALAERS